jgi:hypothetical protein
MQGAAESGARVSAATAVRRRSTAAISAATSAKLREPSRSSPADEPVRQAQGELSRPAAGRTPDRVTADLLPIGRASQNRTTPRRRSGNVDTLEHGVAASAKDVVPLGRQTPLPVDQAECSDHDDGRPEGRRQVAILAAGIPQPGDQSEQSQTSDRDERKPEVIPRCTTEGGDRVTEPFADKDRE